MHSKQRLLAALDHAPVDQLPHNITYGMGAFRNAHFPHDEAVDPFEANLATHTRFGFDPLVGLGGGQARPWLLDDPGRWDSRYERHGAQATYTVETPVGSLSTIYDHDRDMSGWQMTPLIKEEADLDPLAYLPPPEIDVAAIDARWEQLGNRGLAMVSVNGLWQQACYLREMSELAMDVYIRPEWAGQFLDLVSDYIAAQAERLCRSKAECFFINESYLGMGISPKVFDGWIERHDRRLVEIGKAAGKRVLYHDCGLCDALLERFVDLGIDYLEPLNPRAASGDVDPADAKRRIGDQVCIRGGFNHELLSFGDAESIEREVVRCLETLSPGGGYMLCPAGPLDADVSMANLEHYAEAAAKWAPQFGG